MFRGGAGAAVRAGRDRPPSSSRCAFCPRDVHFALENDGWNCTFECERHVSAPEGAHRGRRSSRDAPPGARGGAGCPNLPQRPGSRRGVRRETLILRASSRRRSRRGAPLWQIWTRPRPEPPQEPHPHHSAPARVTTAIPTREPLFPARKAHRFISASGWPPGRCDQHGRAWATAQVIDSPGWRWSQCPPRRDGARRCGTGPADTRRCASDAGNLLAVTRPQPARDIRYPYVTPLGPVRDGKTVRRR